MEHPKPPQHDEGQRMGTMTDIEQRKRSTVLFEPVALRIGDAVRYSGISRSGIYRMAGEGRISLLKAGRSTLVDARSLREVVASLPRASIRSTTDYAA
jgi:hypothetical protein